MQYCLKNDQGEVVSGVRVPKKPEYGTGKFDDNGEELINWEGFRTEYADQHGFRFLYKGIIIKHNKTEPTYTKTSLFLCEKRRFFMGRTEKGGKVF